MFVAFGVVNFAMAENLEGTSVPLRDIIGAAVGVVSLEMYVSRRHVIREAFGLASSVAAALELESPAHKVRPQFWARACPPNSLF